MMEFDLYFNYLGLNYYLQLVKIQLDFEDRVEKII